jgi:hypothetical protein
MRDGLALCAHLAALAPGPAPFEIDASAVPDWHGAPVEAIARCTRCDGCAWLELLDVDPPAGVRIFALAPLAAADAALFLRDRARGSCDVSRERAELEALAASAGRFERLVALAWPERRVVAVAGPGPGFAMPPGPWEARVPAPADARWFARLGLAKGGA